MVVLACCACGEGLVDDDMSERLGGGVLLEFAACGGTNSFGSPTESTDCPGMELLCVIVRGVLARGCLGGGLQCVRASQSSQTHECGEFSSLSLTAFFFRRPEATRQAPNATAF